MAFFIKHYFWLIFFFPVLLFVVPLVNKIKNTRLKAVLGIMFMLVGITYLSFVVSIAPLLLIAVAIFVFSLVLLGVKGYFRDRG